MKKIITLSSVAILLMLGISSCEKTLEFDDSEVVPMLVVYSYIHPDSVIVDVTSSYSTLENNEYYYAPIKNATITISDGTNTYTNFTYHSISYSSYTTNKYGETVLTTYESGHYANYSIAATAGKTYTITVSADGYETVYSEVTMPSNVNIEAYDTVSGSWEEDNYIYVKQGLVVKLTDPAGEENYYQLKISRASYYLYIDTLTQEASQYAYIYDISASIDEESSELEFNNDYLYSYVDEEDCFSDDMNNGKTLNIKIDLGTDAYWIGSGSNYSWPYKEYKLALYKVKLLSISKSMYNYVRTSSTQSLYEEDPFAEPVLVYNNIENGAGNFGAYSSDQEFIIFETVPDAVKSILPSYNSNEELWNIIEEIADSE